MSNLPKLTPRLKTVAGMVRPGGIIADIGTDHAYLPVYLVKSGLNPKVLACDISEGPLERAKKTVLDYGAQDKVGLMLCDGLDGVDYADDIVIAGMGGELIAKILCRCAFVRDFRVALVLQPMTAVPELRSFLCKSGFEIKKESVAQEGTKLYVVMAVAFTGKINEPDEYFCLTGLLPQSCGELEREYLLREADKLRTKSLGLRKSRHRKAEADTVEALAEKIEIAARILERNVENDKSE